MIKIEKGKKYFISRYADTKKKIILPQEIEQEIFDIIRDESQDEFNPNREVDEHDIWESVMFITSMITDIIHDERYCIRELKEG